MKKIFFILFIFSLICTFVNAQEDVGNMLKDYTRPDELVSISANLSFNKAIELISNVSEKRTGKKVVCTVDIPTPVGIELKNVQYEKALVIIAHYANLEIEKKEDVIILKKKVDLEKEKEKSPDTFAGVDAREVKISAVFFEADVNGLKDRGINWQLLLSKKGLNLGTSLTSEAPANTSSSSSSSSSSTTTTTTPTANITGDSKFAVGNFFGEATALFQFIEDEQLGQIIASPNITVRDGQLGKIQVGSDFSIKQKDFAGNTTDFFFQTGIIIEATPFIYTSEGISYVLLKLKVEKSTGNPGELSTEIKKETASTQVLMLDGEETIIGGLFDNEVSSDRVGIPFLKDLPWWFFGIRYLAGNDVVTITKKELVILIKVDLLKPLKERLVIPKEENKIKDEIEQYREKVKYYQFENQKEN